MTVDTSNFTPPNGVSSVVNVPSFTADGLYVAWAEQNFGADTVEIWARAFSDAGAMEGDPFLLGQSEYASVPFISIASGSASAIAYTGLTGDTTNVYLRMLGELPVIEEEEEAEFPIIDNGDSGFEMFGPGWSDTVNNGEGYLGDYDHVYEPVGFNTATWTFTDLADGVYEIFATYTTAPNQAEETPYSIYAEAPELNVEKVEFSEDPEKYIDHEVVPNFKLLGPKLGKLMPKVKKWLSQQTGKDLLDNLRDNGMIDLEIDGQAIQLSREELEVRINGKEGWTAANDRGCVVVLSTELTPELIGKGYSRDIIRLVNDLRKETGCEFTDHIELALVTSAAELKQAIADNAEYIKTETQADTLTDWPIAGAEGYERQVGDFTVTIYIRVLN